MNKTFIDALSHYNYRNDKLSVEFIQYVMKKYFDERRIFMPIKEALPFLDKEDREQLADILEEVLRP